MPRLFTRFRFASVVLLTSIVSARAQVVAPSTQPIRVLAIGNSFSRNATADLPGMLKAGSHEWVFGHAHIGGASLARHMKSVDAFEANPASAAGKPYRIVRPGGASTPASLRDMLQAEPWDYVTVQQASIQSFVPDTFEPAGQRLVAYIRRYAPQAKLVVHETWAYRADSPDFKTRGIDQAQMYARLHANYARFAKEISAAGIIPVGSAFQNVREDPRWKPFLLPPTDLSKLKYPALPPDDHDLNAGYTWSGLTNPRKIVIDRHHATAIGRYLGACVWYEFFFGDVRGNRYRPENVAEADVLLMQELAHRTVQDHLLPQAAATPIRPMKAIAATQPATAPARVN